MDQTHIVFEKLRAKNFFSIGNTWMEFDLCSSSSTLIVGQNGCGKSTLLDALCYSLFGKPYRDIKLGQVVNTINNKAMLIEIEFTVLGSRYKIVRGQKPNIFEIYKDGDLVTQEAATRDYQKYLEKQILKMNHRSFKQLVIMGTAAYTPFMQLKAGDRRQVIEDVLDIAIYSKMGELSRLREREIKSDLTRIDQELKLRRENLVSHQNNLDVLKSDKEKLESERDSKLSILNSELSSAKKELSDVVNDITRMKDATANYEKLDLAFDKIKINISKFENSIASVQSQINKVKTGTHCPTCSQEIPKDRISKAILDLEESIVGVPEKLSDATKIRDQIKDRLTSLENDVTILNDLNSKAKVLSATISGIIKQIETLENSGTKFEAINSLQNDIISIGDLIYSLQNKSADLGLELQYYQIVSSMLKDSGIKSTIVSKYLPVINKLINQYLEMFGLFVGFELSPTFEETIKARHRDTYSYNSFSEGEKAKIDCSILFTWRHIASMKNTVSCNILILDEIGGSSLDSDSYALMVEHLGKVAPNVFLITHRDVEEELFDRVWEFSKPKSFSQYIERRN